MDKYFTHILGKINLKIEVGGGEGKFGVSRQLTVLVLYITD